jgi:ornithine cyclodeaminase
MIWNRTPKNAERMATVLARPGLTVTVADDLASAVARADIVSCATMATTPVIKGAWLSPGAHLDLVGGYRPDMREADDEAVRRARVFIDAWFTAADHCGDICQPLAAGLLRKEDITDTFQLARGERPGRLREDEITLFKSGGGGHEDLGTAQHILARVGGG